MIGSVVGWWLGACAVMMVLCMVMMAPMMGRMRGHGHRWYPGGDWGDDPERTLAGRLARGEIDAEEYHRLLDALRRPRDPARS